MSYPFPYIGAGDPNPERPQNPPADVYTLGRIYTVVDSAYGAELLGGLRDEDAPVQFESCSIAAHVPRESETTREGQGSGWYEVTIGDMPDVMYRFLRNPHTGEYGADRGLRQHGIDYPLTFTTISMQEAAYILSVLPPELFPVSRFRRAARTFLHWLRQDHSDQQS